MKYIHPLPYTSYDALLAAFRGGARFRVVIDGTTSKVTQIARDSGGISVSTDDGALWNYFRSNGMHKSGRGGLRLEVAEAPPACHPYVAPPEARAPSHEKPVLKAILDGDVVHNPKTREVVERVEFFKGVLRVHFVDEAGLRRYSDRYDHLGRHRWVKDRDLVIGPLPVIPPKKVKVLVYRAPWTKQLFTVEPPQILPQGRSRYEGLTPVAEFEAEPAK